MPSRVLPNLGLKAFFTPGEDGWGSDVSQNFLKLSTLVQAGATSMVSSLPGSPTQGSVHVLSAGVNQNKIAIYDAGGWVYLTPSEGWTIYNRATDSFLVFDGAAWVGLPLSRLLDLSGRDVGVAASTSLLDRAAGDARYATIAGTTVNSFNTRTGAITLTQADITATGFTGALSSFNGRTGAVTLTQGDITALTFNFTHLDDVPASYATKANHEVRVNSDETALVFVPQGSQIIAETPVDTTLHAPYAGAFLRVGSASPVTITVPMNVHPIGTRIMITQVGVGTVDIAAASGVQIDLSDYYSPRIASRYSVATLLQYDTNKWQLFGELVRDVIDASSTEITSDDISLTADNNS